MFQISNQRLNAVGYPVGVGSDREDDSNSASSVQPEDFLNLNELPQPPEQQRQPRNYNTNSSTNKLNILS